MTQIVSFPMPRTHVLSLIREAASAGRVLMPNPPSGGDWYLVTTRRQVAKCLSEGDLVGEPKLDMHGNITCTLGRLGAGMLVHVHLALVKNQQEGWDIIVLDVENRL